MGNLPGVFLASAIPTNSNAPWDIEQSETSARAHIKALRLKTGDEFWLLDGQGLKTRVKLIDAKQVQVQTVDTERGSPASPIIDVFLSPPKGDDLDRCIQFCVELGVRKLHLFNSDHCAHTSVLKFGRLHRIAQSSCEQSLNPWLTEIVDDTKNDLGESLNQISSPQTQVIIFDEALAGSAKFFQLTTTAPAYAVFIGPEGGWSARERALIMATSITRASLGPIVLKTPTALCAALSVIRSVIRSSS